MGSLLCKGGRVGKNTKHTASGERTEQHNISEDSHAVFGLPDERGGNKGALDFQTKTTPQIPNNGRGSVTALRLIPHRQTLSSACSSRRIRRLLVVAPPVRVYYDFSLFFFSFFFMILYFLSFLVEFAFINVGL